MKKINIVGVVLLTSTIFAGCLSDGIGGKFSTPKTEEEIIQEKLEVRSDKKPLKLGIVTDVHAYGKEVEGQWEINWRSKDAMERFVEKMNNEFKPSAVVEIGDLVDGKDDNSLEDWKIMDGMMQKLKMPYFNTTGNHEMRSFNKSVWLELSSNEKTYYYKDVNGYRLIILDGNHFSDGQDTTPEKEHYPGNLGDEQWQWLEEILKNAVMEDKDPIVFLHQPPVETDARPNWQLFSKGKELHALFDKYKVRAVFSGHVERLCDIKIESEYTEYFVLQGMWKGNGGLKKEYRFKDAGNFYYVTIIPENIEVKMEYRVFNEKSASGKRQGSSERINRWDNLILNREEYTCQDRRQLMEDNTSGLSEEEVTKIKALYKK